MADPDAYGLTTDDRRLEPFDWFREMRERGPVHRNPRNDRWDVFGYDAATTVLRDHERFSSDTPFDSDRLGLLDDTIVNLDPPRHGKLRSTVEDYFREEHVRTLEPRVRELVGQVLADVEGPQFDVVEAVARPLPNLVIADLLGIPLEDRERFLSWCDALTRLEVDSTDERRRAQREAGQQMAAYMTEQIQRRRERPREDLLSVLVESEVDGEPLSTGDVLGFAALFLIAGNITTTGLLTNAVRSFAERPRLFEDLADDPEALATAVEEVVRYRSPASAVSRAATTDTELCGRQVDAGDHVVVRLLAANHDPARFEDPDSFVPDRSPNPHLGFGHGIHNCIGAALGRLEARVALSELLDRFDVRAVHDGDLTPVRNTFMHAVHSLPVEVR